MKAAEKRAVYSRPINTLTDTEIVNVLGADNDKVAELIGEYVRRQAARIRPQTQIKSSTDAYQVMKDLFFNLPVEHFYIATLSRSNKVINIHKVSEGGVSGTVVDPKVIFKACIQDSASGLIMAHNHPSGNLKPSEADIHITRKIRDGAKLLEIQLLDHVIVSATGFYSFADEIGV